jgi:hypothetical protein
MLANWLAHGPAHLRVLQRGVEGCGRDTDAAGGDVDAAQFQDAHSLLEAEPGLGPDDPVGRHDHVVEGKLRGIDALVSELAQQTPDFISV